MLVFLEKLFYRILWFVEIVSLENVFMKLINMSISAGWLILAVLILRIFLKKSPKWVNVFLWGVVGIRLISPFNFESTLSLIPSAETVPMDIGMAVRPNVDSGINIVNSVVNSVIEFMYAPPVNNVTSANPLQILLPVYAGIWFLGMVVLFTYSVISYWRLCRKVKTAVLYRDNIFQSENVRTPFVLGIIKPRIYLPFGLAGQNLEHVVFHEKAHIRRKDHWWKPLGFLLLTVYWFNPLVWLAYVLLGRDIEIACDENVIKKLDNVQRADYTQALVTCSVNRRLITACPLAFGEVGVKERVKSVMNYKKPAFWTILISVVVCAAVAVCFLTNPKQDTDSAYSQILEIADFKNGEVFQFNEVPWEASKEETEDIIGLSLVEDPYRNPAPEGIKLYISDEEYFLNGISATPYFEFHDDKLWIVQLYFDVDENSQEWFESIVEELNGLYGAETEKFSNSSGKTENVGYKWNADNTSLQIISMAQSTSMRVIISIGLLTP